MADLAVLLGFDYENDASREEWTLHHSSDHQDIREAIQSQGGGNLESWQLYPMNWRDWDAFALRHQATHNDMNRVLGLEGADLTQVDFKDQKAALEWNESHYKEHQAARAKLKI